MGGAGPGSASAAAPAAAGDEAPATPDAAAPAKTVHEGFSAPTEKPNMVVCRRKNTDGPNHQLARPVRPEKKMEVIITTKRTITAMEVTIITKEEAKLATKVKIPVGLSP